MTRVVDRLLTSYHVRLGWIWTTLPIQRAAISRLSRYANAIKRQCSYQKAVTTNNAHLEFGAMGISRSYAMISISTSSKGFKPTAHWDNLQICGQAASVGLTARGVCWSQMLCSEATADTSGVCGTPARNFGELSMCPPRWVRMAMPHPFQVTGMGAWAAFLKDKLVLWGRLWQRRYVI